MYLYYQHQKIGNGNHKIMWYIMMVNSWQPVISATVTLVFVPPIKSALIEIFINHKKDFKMSSVQVISIRK
ncbi:hypothetical protein L596_010118 [Steinernema carpocapsae]|uniref:Uncharacterized protein n=1 Tax=Steinernema carpocapsae TaxID=34508 RepID=A0A4U5PHN4_STECR|nr:hypothetical protein L596_010118 [Steinernema carpocapsae]